MKRFVRGQKGFTLIEIIIVLAILAILAALIVPQVGPFLARGHRAAYDADREVLGLAVTTYRTADPLNLRWPIHLYRTGVPDVPGNFRVGRPVDANNDGDFADGTDRRNGMIDIPRLVAAGLLAGPDAVRSAWGGAGQHRDATSTGRYIWYVADEHGTVRSDFFDVARPLAERWRGDGFQGVYP